MKRLLLAVTFLMLAGLAYAGVPVVRTASSLVRYGQTDAVPDSAAKTIWAARGETESFQVVVRAPAGGLTNVNVTCSNLTGKCPICVESTKFVRLFREYYVHVPADSGSYCVDTVFCYNPLNQGTDAWYPDGLVPQVDPDNGNTISGATIPYILPTLASGHNQPFWIDVTVARAITPGRYVGTITVSANEGTTTIPIALNVWNFELPVKPTLLSSFGASTTFTLAMERELLRNRLMPASLSSLSDERGLIDDFGYNLTPSGQHGGAYQGYCTMTAAPDTSVFGNAHRAHAKDIPMYTYTADEIVACVSDTTALKAWHRAMRAYDIKSLVVMPPSTPFATLYKNDTSFVNIWVAMPTLYNSDSVECNYAINHGMSVWSYNGLYSYPDNASPIWQIDFSPLAWRVQPGFINSSLGLTGLLYWKVDLWTGTSWSKVDTYHTLQHPAEVNHYPGEAMLVYPGDSVGMSAGKVAPSMRLKYLRDGVDDYDYLALLKANGPTTYANTIGRRAGRDWSTWTTSPDSLELVRYQLGTKLNEVFKPE